MKWEQPSNKLLLDEGEAQLWVADLDMSDSLWPRFSAFLSAEEKERAGKFRFRGDRERFAASRVILRTLIGCYLEIEPAEVEFRFGEFGKPFQINDLSLEFNISHSEGIAAFGFTKNINIGVDVEFCRRGIEIGEIASRFFSENEVKTILELPKEKHLEGFFNCWTRKEAFIKAVGKGLSFPLDEFEVSLKPGEPAELLATHWDPIDASNWSLKSFVPKEKYVGALILKGQVERFSTYRVTEQFLGSQL